MRHIRDEINIFYRDLVSFYCENSKVIFRFIPLRDICSEFNIFLVWVHQDTVIAVNKLSYVKLRKQEKNRQTENIIILYAYNFNGFTHCIYYILI